SRLDPRGDRRRRPWARPRVDQPRDQLRSARGRQGLRAPRRQDRPCRPLGPWHHPRAAGAAGGREPRCHPPRAPGAVRALGDAHRPAEARLHEPPRPQFALVVGRAARRRPFADEQAVCPYPCRLTLNEISRRVEIPARIGSPGFDARTNITSRRCCVAAGKPRSMLNCIVTEPESSVCDCDGIENWLNGTVVAYTWAPLTGLPQVSETWNLTLNVLVPSVITPGFACIWVTCRRAGGLTSLAATDEAPAASFGQPLPDGPGVGVVAVGVVAVPAAMRALGTEVAVSVPSVFLPVTCTRTVFPWSEAFRVYALPVARAMS